MPVPDWFELDVYFENKLKLWSVDSENNPLLRDGDEQSLRDAFTAAGYDSDNPDDMYRHFVEYGNSENVSPNSYFDADCYFKSKAVQYFELGGIDEVNAAHISALKAIFELCGLSAWDHYTQYGIEEGINPSESFNTNAYMESKLRLMQAEVDPDYTMDRLLDDFRAAGLNPVAHYAAHGKDEALDYTPGDDIPGDDIPGDGDQTPVNRIPLAAGAADTVGTDGNDMFIARESGGVNTLDSGDSIDGMGGNDTLYAVLQFGSLLHPEVQNVENLFFQAQEDLSAAGSSENLNNVNARIDADDISLADGQMLTLGSVDSRGSLSIEDVRHNSHETTILFQDTDPGQIDFQVYFDPQHLKAEDGSNSGVLNIKLMDVVGAQNGSPLETIPYRQFIFQYTPDGGEERLITLNLGSLRGLSYAQLLEAFQTALTDQELGSIEADFGPVFTSSASVDGMSYEGEGRTIVLTCVNGTIKTGVLNEDGDEITGWSTGTGTSPSSTRYVTEVTGAISSDCPLISTNVQLDNVGRVLWEDAKTGCLPDDSYYGSEADELVIGSMAGRGGVERFDVVVDEGSWLASMSSTNETLRMITAQNGAINDDDQDGNDGQLFIGGPLDVDGTGTGADGSDTDYGVNAWMNAPRLLSTDGLVDVAVFDADYEGNTYKGDINIGASITTASFDKYLSGTDGYEDNPKPVAPVEGYGAFTYNMSGNDDTLNMEVNGNVAADRDFRLNVNMGEGDDVLRFQLVDTAGALGNYTTYTWLGGQRELYDHIRLNAGDGDDIINVYGSGSVVIDAGSGRDWVYSDNSGVDNSGGRLEGENGFVYDVIGFEDVKNTTDTDGNQVGNGQYDQGETLYYGGAVDGAGAIYVLGAAHHSTESVDAMYRQVAIRNGKIVPVDNGVTSTVVTFTLSKDDVIAGPGDAAFVIDGADPSVPVNLTVTVNYKGVASTYSTAVGATLTNTDLNEYIAKAVNDPDSNLSGLMSAQEGGGHSLLLISKVDGVSTLDDLQISFSATQGGDPVHYSWDGYDSWSATPSLTQYYSTGASKEFATVYDRDFNGDDKYDDGLFVEVTGLNSSAQTGHIINLGGGDADNDLLVLSTGMYSSETIVLNKGHNGSDDIVNFNGAVNGWGAGADGQDFFDFSLVLGPGYDPATDIVVMAPPAAGADKASLAAAIKGEDMSDERVYFVENAASGTLTYDMYLVSFDSAGNATVNDMSSINFGRVAIGVKYNSVSSGVAGVNNKIIPTYTYASTLSELTSHFRDYGRILFAGETADKNAVSPVAPTVPGGVPELLPVMVPSGISDYVTVTDPSATYVADADEVFVGDAGMFSEEHGIDPANLSGQGTAILVTGAMNGQTGLGDYTSSAGGIETVYLNDVEDPTTGSSVSQTVSLTEGYNAEYDWSAEYSDGATTFIEIDDYDGTITGGKGDNFFEGIGTLSGDKTDDEARGTIKGGTGVNNFYFDQASVFDGTVEGGGSALKDAGLTYVNLFKYLGDSTNKAVVKGGANVGNSFSIDGADGNFKGEVTGGGKKDYFGQGYSTEISGNLNGGEGEDDLYINGVFSGEFDGGAGNDYVQFNRGSTVTGTVKGGEGSDTFVYMSAMTFGDGAVLDGGGNDDTLSTWTSAALDLSKVKLKNIEKLDLSFSSTGATVSVDGFNSFTNIVGTRGGVKIASTGTLVLTDGNAKETTVDVSAAANVIAFGGTNKTFTAGTTTPKIAGFTGDDKFQFSASKVGGSDGSAPGGVTKLGESSSVSAIDGQVYVYTGSEANELKLASSAAAGTLGVGSDVKALVIFMDNDDDTVSFYAVDGSSTVADLSAAGKLATVTLTGVADNFAWATDDFNIVA